MNGPISKGKGLLSLYEGKRHSDKIGLVPGGYVLARPDPDGDWHLAQIAEVTPIKSIAPQPQAPGSAGGGVPAS